jgi:N-acetylglucosaminyldiphosphoundecaprenol N-acetyl-beta-D-mannosaminyltransferase
MQAPGSSNDHRTRRNQILDVPIDVVDLPGALTRIAGWLDAPDGTLHHVVTVNPEFAIAARRYRHFCDVLWQSALATADGVGIVLAGRVLNVPTGPRVTGNDLVVGLATIRQPAPRLYLLGASPGVAEAGAEQLQARFPGVLIVGTFAGSPAEEDWPEIAARLESARPTTLLVAFGHPRQDLWIAAHRADLAPLGIGVAIGVGGVFDYLAGRIPRAPAWMRRLGLEWLYRLVRQPWRWRRQLALPWFVALVLWERARGRAR